MQAFTAKVADMIEQRHGIDFLGEDAENVPRALHDRLMAGRSLSPVDIGRMNQVRTAIFDGIQNIFFEEYDLLVTPTVSIPPLSNDSLDAVRIDGTPVNSRADRLLTWPFNMTGHPAASVPTGFVDELPIGMQLVGPRFGDDVVLAASGTFERQRPQSGMYETLRA